MLSLRILSLPSSSSLSLLLPSFLLFPPHPLPPSSSFSPILFSPHPLSPHRLPPLIRLPPHPVSRSIILTHARSLVRWAGEARGAGGGGAEGGESRAAPRCLRS
eukprot:215564-Rhodomonas_salina.1